MIKIILKPHSISDLITNSSSELFIYGGDKTVKIIEELCNELWKLYKEAHKDEDDYYIRDYEDFADIATVTLIDESNVEEKKKEYEDWYGYRHRDGYNPKEIAIGSIIIEAGDNAMPYCMQVFLESMNMDRIHLG